MAGALRKTMVYLGLAEEDDTYDRYDDYDERRDRREQGREAERDTERVEESHAPRRVAERPTLERVERSVAPVAAVSGVPSLVEDDAPIAATTPIRRAEVTPLHRRTPVREVVKDMEVSGVHRITTIHPRTYNEAKKIGESFREGTPVIMNLTALDDADAKRLVDFAAGLVFGLQGAIERVTNKVFLLSPADVEVTSVDGEAVPGAKGLFNQS